MLHVQSHVLSDCIVFSSLAHACDIWMIVGHGDLNGCWD